MHRSAGSSVHDGGAYALNTRLGAGAFGAVYSATNEATGAPVAVKVLSRQDPEALYRFKREFRALAGLAHPNLVRLHELVRNGDEWLLVMDLVQDGCDFVRWTRRESLPALAPTLLPGEEPEIAPTGDDRATSGCDPDRLRTALRQLVDGVAVLHSAGRLHRDLKPSNVLVDRAGRVVILDFGMVADRGSGAIESTIGVMGTPAYMAPEVAAGRVARRASDWYAVGVMLYEVLAGRLPFGGDAMAAMMAKQHQSVLPITVPEPLRDLASLACRLLSTEPQDRPAEAEIRACVGTLAGGPPAVEVPTSETHTLLVGRESELRGLREAYQRTERGVLSQVLVHGDPGMGKSALVEHVLEQIRGAAPDTVILRGRCYEHERVPFKAFDGIVDSLTGVLRRMPPEEARTALPRDILILARVFPVLERVAVIDQVRRRVAQAADARETQRRAFSALRELLGRIAAVRPVVLFIDDLQWGDTDSLALWQALVRPPDAPVVLLLGTYRTREGRASPLVRGIAQPELGQAPDQIELGPLPAESAAELAGHLMELAAEHERARAVASAAQGIPFFIGQLTAAWQADPTAEAPTLTEVVGARIAHLDGDARRLLQFVACAGEPIGLVLVARAAQLEEARVEAAVAALRAGKLARTGSDADPRIETYHDLIRHSVVSALAPDALAGTHLQLARTLADVPDPRAKAVARHFDEAGDTEQTVRWALLAAEEASSSLAFEQAAELLQLAIDRHPERLPSPAARALHVSLAGALQSSGRAADSARLLIAAAAGAPELERLDLSRRAAENFLVAGHINEGEEVLEGVLGALDIKVHWTPARALAALLWGRFRFMHTTPAFEARTAPLPERERLLLRSLWSATVGISAVNPVAYGALGLSCFRRARAVGDRHMADDSLNVIHIMDAMFAREQRRSVVDRRIERWREALGTTDRKTPLRTQSDAVRMLWIGRFREAAELARVSQARIRGDEEGITWLRNIARLMESNANMYIGDKATIMKKAPGWLADGRARGDFMAESYFRLMWNAYDTYTTRDFEAGIAVVRETMDRWHARTGSLQFYWEFIAMNNLHLMSAQDPARTWNYLAEGWASVRKSGLLRLRYYYIEAHWYRGLAALQHARYGGVSAQQVRALSRDVRKCIGHCSKHRADWGMAFAYGLRAGVALLEGDRETAVAELERAEPHAWTAGLELYFHCFRYRRGELLGGDEGAGLMAEAYESMERLGWESPEPYVNATIVEALP